MWIKKLISVTLGLLFAFFLCELVLRIYNPFQSRVRGNEIILKSNYKKKITIDPPVKGLENSILYSTNSLGFRGPELPEKTDGLIRIITVGGSTTECSLLSDDSTWSSRLYRKLKASQPDIWLNNAGLDGCSSYGHLILMRDYIIRLKPDYVLFLVGINDLAKSSFGNEDGFLIERQESWWRKLIKKSEFITTVSNVYEAFKSHKTSVAHGRNPYDFKTNPFNLLDSAGKVANEQNMKVWLSEYNSRIRHLAEICQSNGIKPVFITQPKFDDTSAYSWKIMQDYNIAMSEYCRKAGIPCIDLAGKMPKQEHLYYDQIHYTNAGAEAIANILYPEIKQTIQQ